jgi:integrase
MHSLPDIADNMFYKCYVSIGLAMAGRKCEVVDVRVGDVVRVVDENGFVTYHLYFDRTKNTSARDTDRDMCVVACPKGVSAIEKYVALRPAGPLDFAQKKMRFFRKIATTKGGKMSIGWKAQNIGKGPCSEVTKKGKNARSYLIFLHIKLTLLFYTVAALLGKDNSNDYTSHCLRRTAITMGANAGMTMPQLKAMSGHKSDASCEGYIAKSMPMKMHAANALSLAAVPAAASSRSDLSHGHPLTADADLPFWVKHQEGVQPYKMGSAPLDPRNDKRQGRAVLQPIAPRAPVYNITLNITGDVSAPLNILNTGAETL